MARKATSRSGAKAPSTPPRNERPPTKAPPAPAGRAGAKRGAATAKGATSAVASPHTRLRALRTKMDVLNLRLAEALTRRVQLARTIGRTKAQLELPAVDRKREREMLAALVAASDGELPRRELERVFRAVFRASREVVLSDRRGSR